MNRVAAIKCQIEKIGEHVTGSEGFSTASLREVHAAILDAHDLIAGEIHKREHAPLVKKPDGSSAA